MKHPALLPLLVIGIAIFTTNAHGQQPPAPSADPAPAARPKPEALTPPVADPTADPFTRDGKKAAPAPQPEEVAPVNIYALLEYIEVPRDQWFAWSAANPLHGDASALRNEVQKWIAAGQAKPIELACLPTKSGMRTAIESVVERRYPNAFLPGTPTPLPTTFETRATHFTFEWEPVRGPDLVIDSNFIPQLISFCGDEQWTPGARKTAQPGDGGQPRLAVNKATLSMSAAPHQPMLVQVTTPVDEAGEPRDGARLLLFFRAAPVAASPAPKPASPASSGSDKTKTAAKKTTDAIFEVERLEVSLADLNAWFAGPLLDKPVSGLRGAARGWIRAGRGREMDRLPNPVRSGQRCVFEAIQQFRYPTQWSIEGLSPQPHDVPKNVVPAPVVALHHPLLSPSAFETRNLGYTVELEPVLGPEGEFIDLNIVCGDVRHCGNVVFHRTELDGKLVPDIEQPVFGSMRVTTSITLGNGEPALLAIHTPADEQGRPQPERKILTFVTIRN